MSVRIREHPQPGGTSVFHPFHDLTSHSVLFFFFKINLMFLLEVLSLLSSLPVSANAWVPLTCRFCCLPSFFSTREGFIGYCWISVAYIKLSLILFAHDCVGQDFTKGRQIWLCVPLMSMGMVASCSFFTHIWCQSQGGSMGWGSLGQPDWGDMSRDLFSPPLSWVPHFSPSSLKVFSFLWILCFDSPAGYLDFLSGGSMP